MTNPLGAVETAVCVCFFFSLVLSFLSSFQCCICCGKVLHYFFFFSSSDKADKKAEISKLSKMEQERMVCGKIIQYVVNFCFLQFMRNVIQTLCGGVCACMHVYFVYMYTHLCCIYKYVCLCSMSVGCVTVVCLGLYSCERLF